MVSSLKRMIARIGNPILAGFIALSLSPLSAQSELGSSGATLAGIWVGSLRVQSQSLTIVLNVTLEKGELEATIDSPDQGAKGIPVSAISLVGSKVKVESKRIKALLSGELSSDGLRIDGSWSQGGASMPLALEKKNAAPVLIRPQEPKPPFPYKVEEVAIAIEKAGVKLAGTLVLPAGSGPFPAVVMVTGSGQQNRDEELLGHKPFLVLADYLASRGIASLRCDDRGVGGSTGEVAKATTLDFADDAEAAFEYLAGRAEIRKGAVGILGHSEGGLIAPIVASRNASVSFIVLLAGPGLRGEELLRLQSRLIAKAQGASEAEIESAARINEVLYAIAMEKGGEAKLRAKAEKAFRAWAKDEPSMKGLDRKAIESAADQAVAQLISPWFRTFLSLDPALYLSRVGSPVLALNGSKDLQVPADENLAAIEAALALVPGGPDAKNAIVELEGLNHLFQHAGTGSPDEYARIEETFAPEAMAAIADWIQGL